MTQPLTVGHNINNGHRRVYTVCCSVQFVIQLFEFHYIPHQVRFLREASLHIGVKEP